MPDYLPLCERAARAGGAVLQEWVGRFQVREKGPADLVTEADLASQETIRRIVGEAFPDHAFVGEEGDAATAGDPEFCWFVDPLDGTTNYVHQIPHYAVSIGLARRGQLLCGTVFDPVSGECYTAERGQGTFLNGRRLEVSRAERLQQAIVAVSMPAKVDRQSPILREFVEVALQSQGIRRTGSAALNLCYVAAGRFDAFWAKETKAWDVAAGVLLVLEAGGVVTAVDGSPFEIGRPQFVAAATRSLHGELLELVKGP